MPFDHKPSRRNCPLVGVCHVTSGRFPYSGIMHATVPQRACRYSCLPVSAGQLCSGSLQACTNVCCLNKDTTCYYDLTLTVSEYIVTLAFCHAAQGSLGYPGQDQFQGPPIQYQFSNGVLVPNYAVPMPPTALPSSPASMCPSLSHMFDQLGQQAGSGPMPGPPPPPPQRHMANPHAQAVAGGSLDRTGAGYMASMRKGHQGYASSSGEFPLKPGKSR